MTSETLCQLFPKAEEIPTEQRLVSAIHQTTWLVDGELKTWSGKRKTVLSPVCVRLPDGKLQQLEIGSYPVMGEAESDHETFATLIPALLMGNTVAFKPPQYGTLLFTPLMEAFRSAFPKGVINTVHAPGAVVGCWHRERSVEHKSKFINTRFIF